MPPRALEFPLPGEEIQRADGKVVRFYRTNFTTPQDLIAGLSLLKLAFVSEQEPGLGVKIQPFAAQNQVLIEGFPDDVLMVLEAIQYFDVAAPQVIIEIKVIEITMDSNFEYGLDHNFNRNVSGPDTIWRGLSGFLSPPSQVASSLPGGLPFQGTSLLFGLVGANAINVGAFELTLQALQESGKADILSNPHILCTQGLDASITTSEEFQVNRLLTANRSQGVTTSGVGPDGLPIITGGTQTDITNYQSAPAKTGVTLKVTARHVGESFVTLNLEALVKGLAGFASRIGGTLSPIETSREAKTLVTIMDGETLLIGGLYSSRMVREEARTPLLSDLPLIGTMFTRQRESKQKSDLLFMLKPTIVRKDTSWPRVVRPPSELDRLEKKMPVDASPPCGCEPERSIEDALFLRQAWCREQERQAAKLQAREASSASLPPPPTAAGAPAANGSSAPAAPLPPSMAPSTSPSGAPPSVRR